MPDSTAALTVFPNPFRDQVQVQVSTAGTDQVWLTLLDGSGRALRQYAFTRSPGATIQTLPVGDLPIGAYYLKVQTAAWTKTIVIVKQRH